MLGNTRRKKQWKERKKGKLKKKGEELKIIMTGKKEE
jgi:hypothetical protein